MAAAGTQVAVGLFDVRGLERRTLRLARDELDPLIADPVANLVGVAAALANVLELRGRVERGSDLDRNLRERLGAAERALARAEERREAAAA